MAKLCNLYVKFELNLGWEDCGTLVVSTCVALNVGMECRNWYLCNPGSLAVQI